MGLQQLFIFLSLVFGSFAGTVLAADTVVLKPYTREIVLAGFTRAFSAMTVSSEVSGKCEMVLVNTGDVLSAPGVLARLDSTFVSLELEKNGVEQEKTRRRLALENKTVKRYSTLIEKQSAALSTFEEASLQAEINALSLENLKNENRRLEELLARHTLFGPPGWRVVERLVEQGEYITAGQPLFRLGDYRKYLVTLLLTYEELQLLQQPGVIDLHLKDIGADIAGSVYRVSPDFDQQSNKIRVDILVDPGFSASRTELRSGMYVQVRLKKRESDAFVIPVSALLSKYESHWLKTPGEDMVRVLLLGTSSDAQNAIIAGKQLSAGAVFLASPSTLPGIKDESLQ